MSSLRMVKSLKKVRVVGKPTKVNVS